MIKQWKLLEAYIQSSSRFTPYFKNHFEIYAWTRMCRAHIMFVSTVMRRAISSETAAKHECLDASHLLELTRERVKFGVPHVFEGKVQTQKDEFLFLMRRK